jgi:hypothetical protein
MAASENPSGTPRSIGELESPSAAGINPLRILVIEDDRDTRENLCDILELDGYQVETASTIAAVSARDDLATFGAIILDRRLPDGTADEFLPQLKRQAPQASIIVVTGYGDLDGAIAALRAGAADYTLKPVNADALRARLAALAETRRLVVEKQQAESAFRTLVDAAPCLIVISRQNGATVYANSCAIRTTGYSANEINRHLPRDRFVTLPLGSQSTTPESTSSAIERTERHFVCKDGSRRWIVWRTQVLDDYQGSPALMAVGQDITDLQTAQQKALQAERLAAIGEMMAGLSHESRNALQRSKACIEMLELEIADRPEAVELVQRLTKAQEHLQRLYEEVRSYAAPVQLNRELCDLRHIWREVWSHVVPLHPKKSIEFAERLEVDDYRCLVDRFALGQVFSNILENAVAAVPNPGQIKISYEVATLGNRPALEISILDNGPGIDAEQSTRIFEPFFTTKAKGTGLGMAIAKRIIESHGGEISVRDRTPPGAEIIIVLPRGPHE